jgi:hypothetical protein
VLGTGDLADRVGVDRALVEGELEDPPIVASLEPSSTWPATVAGCP